MATELLLIEDWYAVTRLLTDRIAKFPRLHRYSLGQHIASNCCEILADLIRAKYMPGGERKLQLLRQINVELEVLRFRLRLAHDLGALPHGAHRTSLERVMNCGKQLGGWIKLLDRKPQT